MPIQKSQGKQKITPFLWFNNQDEEAMKFSLKTYVITDFA